MIEGCRDGVMIELMCRGWIEMLVVSSSQDVVAVWMFNRFLLCVCVCVFGVEESHGVQLGEHYEH